MHKIFKTLYFADQSHLSKYGRTITGDVYIAMQYGPVPSKTDDIFKAVRGDSYFHDDELNTYFHFVNKYIVEANKKADLDYLSESDLECLKEAIEKCKDKSFDELTKMSHGLAWENTRRDRTISFRTYFVRKEIRKIMLTILRRNSHLKAHTDDGFARRANRGENRTWNYTAFYDVQEY